MKTSPFSLIRQTGHRGSRLAQNTKKPAAEGTETRKNRAAEAQNDARATESTENIEILKHRDFGFCAFCGPGVFLCLLWR
jgi:RNA polymerase-binding transcription factor DksA